MKKSLAIVIILALLVSLCACDAGSNDAPSAPSALSPTATPAPSQDSITPSQDSAPETGPVPTVQPAKPVELIVFAAASMTETLNEIAVLYKSAAPDVTLIFNFDSSGTLKTQIQEGADCDIFISAGIKQADQLDITADSSINTEGLDFILQGTRLNLLENRVTLCVPSGNPAGIESFDDFAVKIQNEDILLAMGNSDVPVGQYTQKIFAYYGLDEDALARGGKITYGSNVKEVTTQVAQASVSCGVVYCTDAYSAGLEIVDYATAGMCGQVIYPAAVLNVSANAGDAKAFLDYLQTSEAMAVFEKVGFAAVY